MRTHAQIIQQATTSKVREVLAARGLPVSVHTVRSWLRRPDENGSIPAAYWAAIASAKLATFSELAAHAETIAKRGPKAA